MCVCDALFMQFTSFKAKTSGAAKTAPAGKTAVATRSITGKPTAALPGKPAPGKKDDKKPAGPRKEGLFCVLVVWLCVCPVRQNRTMSFCLVEAFGSISLTY